MIVACDWRSRKTHEVDNQLDGLQVALVEAVDFVRSMMDEGLQSLRMKFVT